MVETGKKGWGKRDRGREEEVVREREVRRGRRKE